MKRQVYKILNKEVGGYSTVTTDDLWLEVNETQESGGTWGSITGTLSDQTDLQSVLDDKLDADADATPTVKGIAKLYTALGSNEDGSITQKVITDALATIGVSTTYYVSNNGLDTNNGKSYRTPFLTLAKLMTVLANGDEVKLECGSRFNEAWNLGNLTNISISSFGIGDKPFLDGSKVINTPTLVSGNVWTTSNLFTVTGNSRLMIMENGVPMQPVANISECQALPNSYVIIAGDSPTVTGTYAVQFHPSDSLNPTTNGKVYTTNAIECVIINYLVSSGIKFENIELAYSSGPSGMAVYGNKTYFKNCVSRYGTKHNIFVGANAVCDGVVAYGAEIQGQYSRTASIFVAYTAITSTTDTYTFKNCLAVMNIQKTGQKLGLSLIAFLEHVGAGYYFKTGNFINCYVNGTNTSISTTALNINVDSMFAENMSSHPFLTTGNTIIKNSFLQVNSGSNTSTYNGVIKINNTVIFKMKISGASTGLLDFISTIFINFLAGEFVESISLFDQTTLPTQLNSFGCVYFNNFFSLAAASGKYTGDYNVFSYTTSGQTFRAVYGGTQYGTLSSWQTATSQDANSVYLTEAQKKIFFIGDPKTGDVMINPLAEVTSASGTVYYGTFPDGTRLTDKIKNKMFQVNRRNFVDEYKYKY